MIAAITQDKKKQKHSFLKPNTIPISPNNFISPPPIPPLLTIMIDIGIRIPATPPVIVSHQGVSGSIIRKTTKIGRKNNRTLFGIIIYVISDTSTITNMDTRAKAKNNSNWIPIIM